MKNVAPLNDTLTLLFLICHTDSLICSVAKGGIQEVHTICENPLFNKE